MNTPFGRYFLTAWLIVGGSLAIKSAYLGFGFAALGFLVAAPVAAIGAYMKVAIDRRREARTLPPTVRPKSY